MTALTGPEMNTMPLDKSYYMRLGLLSLIYRKQAAQVNFLKAQSDLPDDLVRLSQVLDSFETSDVVNVGESGTLYRFIQYYCWASNIDKHIKKSGTLMDRQIVNDSSIISLSQTELLKLDNETSQWASAKALCGDAERLANPPFKLALTYRIISDWLKISEVPYVSDPTIKRQAEAFKLLLDSKHPEFKLEQAEDFAFGVVFGFTSVDEGARLWPSLYGHESNRPAEIKQALSQLRDGEYITSRDHRIVQAVVMKAKVDGIGYKTKYPGCVTKSWPRFFEFIDLVT